MMTNKIQTSYMDGQQTFYVSILGTMTKTLSSEGMLIT